MYKKLRSPQEPLQLTMKHFNGFKILGHLAFSWFIILPFWFAGFPWHGFAASMFYWLGRERRDYEIKVGIQPHTEWFDGWNPFKWAKGDLFGPLLNGIVIYGIDKLI